MGSKAKKKGIDTRQKVYAFLVEYMTKNGYVPSVREICAGTDLSSTSSVYKHLQMLELMGKIEMKGKSPRAIKLVGYKLVKEEG